ncbi:zinc finger, CCHC-type containing protein [Tanacetum coccineum]
MAGNTVKEMTTNFGKLDKFEGHDFRRWQKKMHFLLTTLKVVYVLTTPMPELLEDATVEAIRIRAKWENDDYICRGHILNGMSDSLFDVYTNVESAKELWDSLESKYMAEDSSSKKFLVSNFNNYKMVDSRPVMEQYNELLRILGQYTQHGLKMDESISVSSIIDKLPPSCHLRIEESLRAQDSDKGKGKEVAGPSVNMTEEGKNKNNKQNKGKKRDFKEHVVIRRTQMLVVRERGLRTIPKTKVDAIAWWIDSGATTHVCKDRCWFKTYEPVEDGSVLYMGDDHFAMCCMFQNFNIHKLHLLNTTATMVGAERKYRALEEMVNSMLSYSESRDAIFDENHFFSIPRPKDIIPNSDESQRDDHFDDVPSEIPEPRKGKRVRKAKSYGSDFQLYLVEGSRDQVGSQYSYCYSIEEDPRTYNEAMQSRDFAFWKEAIDDEIGSIMENNTWVLSDLPPGCKPLGCKWIFKRKMKVDGTIDKFKARLVIQGFRQKEGIDYFDTYAPVARITTIRLLLALAAIHNLVIHQMDVKTAFLNGDLEEEVYMKQPEGFVMSGNEHKLYLVEGSRDQVGSQYSYCYSIEEDPRTYNEAMQSRDFAYWKEAIDDEFGSIMENNIWVLSDLPPGCKPLDQNQVDKTKKFLSSRFSMKDMGEADVILGIKIKRENKGIVITQSHYIEKILKKFNREDCSPVSTPMDPVEKLKPNTGKPVDQLEYSRAIGCLMYAMTSTRPDIAYAVGRLSRFTSNPSRQHWQAITRVFKYLKGTMNYGLSYVGYPSVLEAYSDASWINHVEDSSSTSGWVFLLGGGAISWASKKQTCITGSTMESEFVALAAAGKEAEWLRNLIHEIPIWPKPIAPISIRCDSAPTMAKAYSQIYNGKSRHLGVRHSMVRELIRNGVISIEFVRTQHNLADHLTKGAITKRTTYVNMKFCRFKKLGLGFRGHPLRGQGAAPLAGSRGRAPCWGRGGAPLVGVWGQRPQRGSGQRPDPNGIFGAPSKLSVFPLLFSQPVTVEKTVVKVGFNQL